MKVHKNYINNTWTRGAGVREIINPFSEEVIACVTESDEKDVSQAVAAAREAFDKGPWRQTSARTRGKILFKVADIVRKHAYALAKLETANCGKPIGESSWDLDDVVACFEYYGGFATKLRGETMAVPEPAINFSLKEPVGVCALIIPWNYPLLLATWKLAPALAAGCSVIIKPAEQTPLTVIELCRLIHKHVPELPKGVLNVVTGDGPTAGRTLVRSPLVDKVSFTGGTETAREVLRGIADSTIKKISLELGGKSPNIFFEDTDIEAATDGALFGVFTNQGEICSAGSRVLIQEKIYKKFLDRMIKRSMNLQLGDPMEHRTKMGPLISAKHLDKVMSYLEIGTEHAKLLVGGKRPKRFKKGFFLEPTIFETTNDTKIAREEIFGPVVACIPFKDESEAIEIANDTPYGLAAAVWSRDIFRCLRVVKAIRAGIVWVNTIQNCYAESPWGGYKQSGQGRELGLQGIEEFLETKQVHISLNEQPSGSYT